MHLQFLRTALLCGACLYSTARAANFHVDAGVASSGNGSVSSPFKTIQEAANAAQPGDTVLVATGVYRERVKPPRGGTPGNPITYRAAVGAKPVITGLDPWNPTWTAAGGNRFSAIPGAALFTDTAYVDGGNPYVIPCEQVFNMVGRDATHTLSLGHVVVDGVMWEEMGRKADMESKPRSWWCDLNTGRIFIHFPTGNPAAYSVEITTRRGVFRPYLRALGYIVVDGFTMEYCANQFPHRHFAVDKNHHSGLLGTSAGHHWTIRNCILRRAKSVAITVGGGGLGETGLGGDNEIPKQPRPPLNNIGYNLIENNVIEFCGSGGIQGLGHQEVVVSSNYFRRVNYLEHKSYVMGAVKFLIANDPVVAGNVFEANLCMAVWYDNTVKRGRISRNLIHGSSGPSVSGDGVFLELADEGADNETLVDNNVIIGCERYGIYTHDASFSLLANNLIMGSGLAGIHLRDTSTDRKGDCHDHRIYNNLILDNHEPINLPFDQADFAFNNESDRNVLWPASETFAITTYGNRAANPNTVMTQIFNAWQAAGSIAPSLTNARKWPTTGANGGYRATLAQWRAIRSNDSNSVYASVSQLSYDPDTYTLTLNLDNTPATVGARALAGITNDYQGNAIGPAPKAGPFQNIAAGLNTIALWPGYQDVLAGLEPIGGTLEEILADWTVSGEVGLSTAPFALGKGPDFMGVFLNDQATNNSFIERALAFDGSGTFHVQLDFRYTGSVINAGLQLSSGATRGINLHLANSAGKTAVNQGSGFTDLGHTLLPDTWYRFTITVHPLTTATDTFDLRIQSLDLNHYFDEVYPALGFQNNVASLDVLKLHFNLTQPAGVGGEFHLGNVIITGSPDNLASLYQTWLETFRDVSEIDLGTGLVLDDADGDSVHNLHEFAFGGTIGLPDGNPAGENVSFNRNTHTFAITRRTLSAFDTQQTLQYSTNLVTWTSVSLTAPVSPGVSAGPSSNGLQQVTVTIPPPATTGRLFWRFIVTE